MPNQGSESRSQEPRFPERERTGAEYARAAAERRMTPDEAFRRDVVSFMQTLSATIDAFVARWDDGAWVDAESAGIALDAVREAVAAASASTIPRPSANGFATASIRAGRMHDLAPPPLPSIAPRVPTLVPPRPVLRPSRAPRPASSLDDIRRVFTERLAARTGYPLDMLEEHLDLEADLGIDTVKQIAVMGETREHFGLPVDPTFKLRHYPTIASFSAHLAKRLGVSRAPAAMPVASKSVRPRSVPARAPSIAPRAPAAPSMPPRAASLPPSAPTYAEVRDVFLARLVAKTGYPLDMLEDDLDLEADLGIDTVKQIAVMGETRERFGLAVDARFKLRHYPTIRSFCTYLLERIAGSGGPAEGPPRSGGSGGTRVSNGGGGGGGGAELAATIQLPIELDGPGTALGSGGWVGEVAALRLRDGGLRLVDIRIDADDSSDDAKGVLRVSPDGVVRMTAPHGRISAEAQRTEGARPQAGELRPPDWLAELTNADRNWSLIAESADDAIASIGASARRFRAVRAPRFDEILAQAEIPADASVAAIVAIVFETTLAASRLLHVACTGQIAEPVRVESFAVERLPAAGSRISLRACLRAVGRHAVECVAEDGTALAHAEGIAIGSGQGPSPMPSSPRLLERRTWLRLRRELAQSFEHEASL